MLVQPVLNHADLQPGAAAADAVRVAAVLPANIACHSTIKVSTSANRPARPSESKMANSEPSQSTLRMTCRPLARAAAMMGLRVVAASRSVSATGRPPSTLIVAREPESLVSGTSTVSSPS